MKKTILVGAATMALLLAACSDSNVDTVKNENQENTVKVEVGEKETSYTFGLYVEEDLKNLNPKEKEIVESIIKATESKSVLEVEDLMLEELPNLSISSKDIVFYHYNKMLRNILEKGLDGKGLSYDLDQEISEEIYMEYDSGKVVTKEEFLDEGSLSDKSRLALEEIYFNSLKLVEKSGYIFPVIDAEEIKNKFEEHLTPMFKNLLEIELKDQSIVTQNKDGSVNYSDIIEQANKNLELLSMEDYYADLYKENAGFYISWAMGYYEYLATSEPINFSNHKDVFTEIEEGKSMLSSVLEEYINIFKENDYKLTQKSLDIAKEVLKTYNKEEHYSYMEDDLNTISFE